MVNILETIKELLGLSLEDEVFDQLLIIYINTVIFGLSTLGFKENFVVDKNTTWEDYLDGTDIFEGIKTYIYLKVRLIFDPPERQFLLSSINDQLEELEWRLSNNLEEGS